MTDLHEFSLKSYRSNHTDDYGIMTYIRSSSLINIGYLDRYDSTDRLLEFEILRPAPSRMDLKISYFGIWRSLFLRNEMGTD